MRSIAARGLWFVVTALFAAAAFAAQKSTSSEDEKGKTLVQSKCTMCHGLEEVEAANVNEAGWKEIVDFMRTKGADLKDDEVTTLVNYLTKTYSADPDSETKKVVDSTCGSCHGMDIVISAQKTKEEWTGVVKEMISKGADIQESQIAGVADYLSRHYGPNK